MNRVCVFASLFVSSLVFGGLLAAQDQLQPAMENPFAENILGALFDKRVQQDLELVEDQRDELKTILAEIESLRTEMGEELKSLSDSGDKVELENRRKEMVQQFAEFKKKSEASVYRVLLPHQKERLGQLTAQLMLRRLAKTNGAGVLAPEMRKYLGIEDEQAERIRQRTQELSQRLAEEIKKLSDKAKAEMMDELTLEQQRKYNLLIGDPVKN